MTELGRAESPITIVVPDVDQLSDDELAEVAFRRDGRWSEQTKALLLQFGVSKLDLNRGWAATWTGWNCPCCGRSKQHIARKTSAELLLCRLEVHHDHLADHVKAHFRTKIPRGEDRYINIGNDRAGAALVELVERFERALICIDCNLAEGRAKLGLSSEIPAAFSFSPSEIASFIEVSAHQTHTVDIDKARQTWLSIQSDFEHRLDFARRMTECIAKGRHRREITSFDRNLGPIDDNQFIHGLFMQAAPRELRYIGMRVEQRSVSNDSAGTAPKVKLTASALTEEEFAAVDAAMQSSKPWVEAGPDWICPCCARSKRAICRKSNKGRWTARIHRMLDYEPESNQESLLRRYPNASSQIIIGSHRHLLICQDCRNIPAEVKRRQPSLSGESLSISDLRDLVPKPVPHAAHGVDYQRAIEIGLAAMPLARAIEDYRDHCAVASRTELHFRLLMKLPSWSKQEAIDYLGFTIAKENDWDFDEGDAHAVWLIAEGARIRRLDALS